jgi:hypothetical protein
MKKIASILLLTTFNLAAQQTLECDRSGFAVRRIVDRPSKVQKGEGVNGVFSEWLDYQTGYEAYWAATSALFANNLFPDSTVLVQYSSGLGAPWIHQVGQVFDLKALPLAVQYSSPFSQSESYVIDSVQIGLLYNRVNMNPNQFDTVIVQVVLPSASNLSGLLQFTATSTVSANLTGSLAPVIFPELEWSHSSNSTPGVTSTYKIPIGDDFFADSTSNGLHFLSLAANIPVPVSMDSALQGVFSVNYSFKPGYSWNLNSDTLGVSVNSLRFLSWELNGQGTYPGYLGDMQTAYILPIEVRYNQAGGWNGRFIPSYAFMGASPSYAYEDHLVFVKVSQVNSIGLGEMQESIKIAPNPANDFINVEFTQEVNELSICDLNGKVLKVVQLNQSSHSALIDLSDLSSGVYFIESIGLGERHKFVKL